jgi:hypothetical protein
MLECSNVQRRYLQLTVLIGDVGSGVLLFSMWAMTPASMASMFKVGSKLCTNATTHLQAQNKQQ